MWAVFLCLFPKIYEYRIALFPYRVNVADAIAIPSSKDVN